MIRVEWADTDDKRRALAKWVSNQIWPRGNNSVAGQLQAFAVADGSDVLGATLFHNWDPEAGIIELTSAANSKRWLTRSVLKEMFEYVFLVCKCQACVMRVADENKPMHRIAKAYGFKHYVIPRIRGRNANENVFVLTIEAWNGNRFNRKNGVLDG